MRAEWKSAAGALLFCCVTKCSHALIISDRAKSIRSKIASLCRKLTVPRQQKTATAQNFNYKISTPSSRRAYIPNNHNEEW